MNAFYLFVFSVLLAVTGFLPSSKAADPFAKAVVFSRILNGNSGNNQSDPARILGPANGVEVSLGGPGASIIVDMGAETPVLNGAGPDVEIREIGAAFGGVDESYRVLVSNSTDTNSFVLVGVGRALSIMDIGGTGLGSARYIWIQDLATETLGTPTPGSDIDSVRAINYSGAGEDLPPPPRVTVRPTGQGAWISWSPSPAPNVTGYAVRRSLDGISFSSTPEAAVSGRETAWHDINLPRVGPVYYAVSTIAGSSESALAMATLITAETAVMTNLTAHLGDDVVARWEVPDPEREVTWTFELSGFAAGPQAELVMEVWDADNNTTPVSLNGARIGSVPVQSEETWGLRTLKFPAGALQAGTNTLTLGGAAGTLDDLLLRNVRLITFGVQGGGVPDLITTARFTDVLPGQTMITLRWVVQQTPTLSPPEWETVSNPLEWTGQITSSNGFYRLQEVE